MDYKNITKMMDVGGRIFIDDGLISVIVKDKGMSDLHTVSSPHLKISKAKFFSNC